MSGSNPLQVLGNLCSDAWGAVQSLADDVDSAINIVFTPITDTITSLGEEFGSGISAIMSEVGTVVSDVASAGETFANAVGAAASDIASEAATGLNSVLGAADQILSIPSEIGNEVASTLGSLAGGLLTNVEDFASDYGHALIDAAADALCPGSSVLIDVAWDIASNGELPTLQGLAQDGADALVGEIAPGIDDALASALPDAVGDIASNAVSPAIEDFANYAGLDDSSSTIVTNLTNGLLAGTLGSFGSATDGAITGLSSLLGYGDLTASSLLDAYSFTTLVSSAGSMALDMTTSVANLEGLTPAEIQALGGAADGDSSITAINATPTANDPLPEVDIAQALALGSAGISLTANINGGPVVKDLAASIELLSAAAMAKLQAAGITTLAASDGPLVFNETQALDLLSFGLAVKSPAPQSVTLQCTQSQYDALTQTQLEDLSKDGFSNVQITDATSVGFDFQQANGLNAANLKIDTVNTVVFDATTADVASFYASVTGTGATPTLTQNLLEDFISNGINQMNISGSASALGSLSASEEISLGSVLSPNQISYTVSDTVKDLLNAPNVRYLKSQYPGLTWNVSDSIRDLFGLTSAARATLTQIGVTGIICNDTPTNIGTASAASIKALGSLGVTTIESTLPAVTIGEAQATGFVSAGITFQLPVDGSVTLTDNATNLSRLSVATINALPALGVSQVISTSQTTSLNTSQLLALSAGGLTLEMAEAGAVLSDHDTPGNIAALDNQQIDALAAAGVTNISTAGRMALTLGQCFALAAEGISVTDSVKGDFLASDTAFDISALTVDQIAKLQALGVTQIAVTNGSPSMTAATAAALEQAKIKLMLPANAIASVTDGAFGGVLMQLTASQIGALPGAGIKTLRIADGAAMSAQQALAILSAGLQVEVAPDGASQSGYVFEIADTASNIGSLTATQLFELNQRNISGLFPIDTTLDLSVAQIEQTSAIQTLSGNQVLVVDTAAEINANWNYLNQLRGAGQIAGVAVVNQAAPTLDAPATFSGTPGGPMISATQSLPFATIGIVPGQLPNGGVVAAKLTVSITILNASGRPTDAEGTLTLAGTGLSKTGVGTYQLGAASAAAAAAELQAVQFNASTAPGSDTSVTMALAVSDGSLTTTQKITVQVEHEAEVFLADGVNPSQIWVSNGTPAGTAPLAGTTEPFDLTQVGPRAIYIDHVNSSSTTQGIFTTNGSTPGVLLALPDSSLSTLNPFLITTIGGLSGDALINGTNAEGAASLWVTNGTAAGTFELHIPGVFNEASNYASALGTSVLFDSLDSSNNDQLWIANSNFRRFTQLTSTPGGAYPYDISTLGSLGLFAESVGVSSVLGFTNGTVAGTGVLAGPQSPQGFTAIGTLAVFSAEEAGSADFNLWRTDGTESGTTELSVQGASSNGLQPENFTALGDVALFEGIDASGNYTAWVTDGNVTGSYELEYKGGGIGVPIEDPSFAVFGDRAIIAGYDSKGDACLFMTDGTNTSLTELYSFENIPGLIGFGIQLLGSVNNEFYFSVQTALSYGIPPISHELWATNGTASGTGTVSALSAAFPEAGFPVTLDDSGSQVGTPDVSLANAVANTAITVPANTNLVLNKMSFMSATATGGDIITATGAGQTLVAGARPTASSPDTLIGSNVAGDLFTGTSANLNGEIIQNFIGSDVIDITDMAYASYSMNFANGILSISDGTHSASINMSGNFSASSFTFASDQRSGTVIALKPNQTEVSVHLSFDFAGGPVSDAFPQLWRTLI